MTKEDLKKYYEEFNSKVKGHYKLTECYSSLGLIKDVSYDDVTGRNAIDLFYKYIMSKI